MKQVFTRLIALSALLFSFVMATAQDEQFIAFYKNAMTRSENNPDNAAIAAMVRKDQETLAAMRRISQKLFLNFIDQFQNPWKITMQVDRQINISCMVDGQVNRATFSKKGTLINRTKTYNHSDLPEAITNLVNEKYPGHWLFGGVSEIEQDGITTWFLTIENRTSWKRIKISNNETEVHESHKKSAEQVVFGLY